MNKNKIKMVICDAKFLTNYNLKKIYTKIFKANVYEFIYIKTMVTQIGWGGSREKFTETHNDLAQELNQNTNKKMFLKFDKGFKKILKTTTIIEHKKSKTLLQEKSTKINEVLEDPMINTKSFFKRAVSVIKLKEAWLQIENNLNMLVKKSGHKIINNISNSWFENTSQTLTNDTLKYLAAGKINIYELASKTGAKFLNITNPKIKIIERALLNHLEVIFEGAYIWITILETEFKKSKIKMKKAEFKSKYKVVMNKKIRKHVYKKKDYVIKRIFKSISFGYRTGKSAHQALYYMKTKWINNTVYFLDYALKKLFNNVNRNRLKNTFNRYVKDFRFWKEIKKMLGAGYIKKSIIQIQKKTGINQNSILSPFFFNVYMHNFDQFMGDLNKKHFKNNRLSDKKNFKDLKTKKSYTKLVSKYSYQILKIYRELGLQEKFITEKKCKFVKHHKKYSKTPKVDKMNKYIQYIRYANDLFIGIMGSYKFVIYIQKDIDNFIKSNLHLEISKNKITYKKQPFIMFLTHDIQFVNLYPKIGIKNKKLEAIYRYKNKSIQKLKLEENRIVRLKANKFRNKILKYINTMLKKLTLENNLKQNFDLLASLFAYKFFGVEMINNLNFNSLEKLIKFLSLVDENEKFKNVTLKKLYNAIDKNVTQNEKVVKNNIYAQIKNLKHFGNYRVNKVELCFKEIQNIIESKIKLFSKSITIKLIENKIKQIKNLHMNKQKKKLRIAIPPIVKSEQIFETLFINLVKSNSIKQSVKILSVKANIAKICNKLKVFGFMHSIKNQAISCRKLIFLLEDEIIKHYNFAMRGILNWFSGADNFYRVKGVMEWIMRRSCLLTLKKKFKLKSLAEVISIYTTDVSIVIENKFQTKLISKKEIIKMPNTFKIGVNPITGRIKEYFNWETILNQVPFKSYGFELLEQCVVKSCKYQDIEMRNMYCLERKVNINGIRSIKNNRGNKVLDFNFFLSVINRKQILLCKKHYRKFEKDEGFLVNKVYLNRVFNRNNNKHFLKFADTIKVTFKKYCFKMTSKNL